MTNGEKFKQIFSITQVDEGELYAFAWLPNHDAAEFSIEWWNAEYKEPKTGHWIDTNDDGFVYHRIYKCSHCGAIVCEYPENMHESKYNYCSTCGIKMVEPQESEDKK